MKRFKAWRYKCDFCGKNGRQGGAMLKHEKGCTANPQRACGVHKYVSKEPPPPVAEMVTVLRLSRDADHGLKALRDIADDCPCCILAALRQSGLCAGYADEEGYTPPKIGKDKFDFAKELAEMWADKNEAEADAREYHGY